VKEDENRKELIANISHDLKTPVTAIKGYIEGLILTYLPGFILKYGNRSLLYFPAARQHAVKPGPLFTHILVKKRYPALKT
jgi:signal transduction histidine kinase